MGQLLHPFRFWKISLMRILYFMSRVTAQLCNLSCDCQMKKHVELYNFHQCRKIYTNWTMLTKTHYESTNPYYHQSCKKELVTWYTHQFMKRHSLNARLIGAMLPGALNNKREGSGKYGKEKLLHSVTQCHAPNLIIIVNLNCDQGDGWLGCRKLYQAFQLFFPTTDGSIELTNWFLQWLRWNVADLSHWFGNVI